MTVLAFTVLGRPATAGSKVAVPIVRGGERVATRVVESGDRSVKAVWREDVRVAARQAIGGSPDWPCAGPCVVWFVFVRGRPKSHYGRRGGVPYLLVSAPASPIGRPDLLKTARALEDALSGIVWRDDAQIVEEHLHKLWGDEVGVRVMVRQLRSEDQLFHPADSCGMLPTGN